ncbi:hypothetical protein QR98_0028030 [Sarcoptes scabiei]|uniref:Uncharacterized protein n=1 Tax=Sarcoptes scabiei TaxID=52283 RepID=A0A132A0N4_SARSC|nr:hypothetical protein QR98_0028030 [Sarcoptes scabiei]
MPFTLAPLMPLNSPDSDFSLDQSPIPNVFFQPNSDNSLQSVYMDSVDDLCPSALIRGLFWNSIRKNEVTSQKCPGGTLGVVKWSCMFNPELGVAEWYPPRPDFTECRSIWLENLAGQLNNREPVIKIASELALMTSSKLLYSEDLIKIASIINKFLENAVTSIQNVQTIEVWHRHQVLKELLMFIVEIISNLLGNIQDDAWLDLSIINRKEIASSFIRSLEKSALLLAENTNHDGSTAIAKPNVLVSVHVLDTRMPISLQFPTYEDTTGTNDWARMEDSIFLPAQSLVDHTQGGLAKVSFFAYYRIEDLLKPSPQNDFEKFNMVNQLMSKNLSLGSYSINSHVIGAALSQNEPIHQHPIALSQPVTIVLRHTQVENISNQQCVYWNNELQNWLTDGCWTESSNLTHTVCMCNHLTHFALLSEIKTISDQIEPINNLGRFLVIISCSISTIVLLMITILIFLTPIGNKVSASINRNLYATLLFAQIIYILVLNLSENISIFASILATLHYFLLATFCWTFFASFDIYINVNLIYEHFKSSKRLWWYFSFAYLSPLLIVIVCLSPIPSYYCDFLRLNPANNYIYLTFIGPFIALILGSSVFVLFAYVIIRNHSVSATTIKCFEDIRVGGCKNLISWISILTLLQSINWSSAFAYLFFQESQIVSALFAIINLSFAIFLALFCLLKTDNIQHSKLFRYLPFSFCNDRPTSQLSTKHSTTSDCYSTRPVVTQITPTQVNGMTLGHLGTQSPTAISPVSMSPCITQVQPLPIVRYTSIPHPGIASCTSSA